MDDVLVIVFVVLVFMLVVARRMLAVARAISVLVVMMEMAMTAAREQA